MSDNISKIMMVIIIVVMVVFIPSLMVQMRNEMVQSQMILYETKYFIDKVTERGEIQPRDIELLEVAVNMYGGAYDVEVEKQIRDTGEPEPDDVIPVYYRGFIDDVGSTELNLRDGVRVHVRESKPDKGLYHVLVGFHKPPYKISLMGTVK